jgi:cell division septum initiation protein DivIVA
VPQNDSEFTRVLRGYDAAEVDKTIHKLRRELLALKTGFDEQAATIVAITRELERIEANAEQLREPTFSGLGAKLASTLSIAEEQSVRLVGRANAEALSILAAATRDSEQLRVEANTDARHIREAADVAATETLNDAHNRAHLLVTEAEHNAQVLVSDAEDSAGVIRGDSATEIANARTTAKRDLEQQLAEHERQMAEARLVLVAKGLEGVDISEQLMHILKVDADRAARIDEAEADFLARHQEAVAQTQKYVDDGQAQAAVARTSALERERATLAMETEAIALAHTLRTEAAAFVARVTTESETRAAQLVSQAASKAALVLAEAEAEVANLRVEREAVASYFEGLRLVLSQTSDVMLQPEENPHLNS